MPTKKKSAKTVKIPKTHMDWVYVGGQKEAKIWDQQMVTKGEPFTAKTEACAKNCAASPYFEKA